MSTFRAITAAASAGRFCSGRLSGSVSSAVVVVARHDVNIPSPGFPVVSPVSSCFYARKNLIDVARTIAAADLTSPAIKPFTRRSYGRSTRSFTSKPVDGDASDAPPPPVDGDASDVPPPPDNGETSKTHSVSPWKKMAIYASDNFADMSYWTLREGFFLMTFSLFGVAQISGIVSHAALMTALERGFDVVSIESNVLFEAVKTGFEEALKGADSTTLSDEEVKAIAETVADTVAKKIHGSRGWWRFW